MNLRVTVDISVRAGVMYGNVIASDNVIKTYLSETIKIDVSAIPEVIALLGIRITDLKGDEDDQKQDCAKE